MSFIICLSCSSGPPRKNPKPPPIYQCFGNSRIRDNLYSETLFVTLQLGLGKYNFYVRIDSQLGYLLILISNGLCQYEGKYAALNKKICHFSGLACFAGKKPKAQKHTNHATLRSEIFHKRRSVMVPRLDYFSGFTDKG